jgi:hypothetical protein
VVRGAAEDVTWRNVSIVLYDENRTVIKRYAVGKPTTRDDGPAFGRLNVTAPERPAHIVVESPDFWTHDGGLGVDSWVWRDGRWQRYSQDGPNDRFPESTPTD